MLGHSPASRWTRPLGFQARLGITTGLLVAIVCAGLSWQLARGALDDLRTTLLRRGRSVAATLARDVAGPLAEGDADAIADLAEGARQGGDALAVQVFDPAGLVVAMTGSTSEVGGIVPRERADVPSLPVEVGESGWQFWAPVEASPRGARPVGFVGVITSRAPLAELHSRIVITAVVFTLCFMIVGGLGALAVARTMTGSLTQLVRAAGQIAGGDFATRVPVERGDEIGTLGAAFNTMTASLAASRAALESTIRELERANHLKSEFLATVSHELRTPLNVILGHTEMLEEMAQSADPEQAGVVHTIRRYALLQLDLITSVLDFERLASGTPSLRVETFDVRTVVDDVLALYAPRARGDVQLLATSEPGGLAPLETDRIKVHQVLRNLVDNAVKFTESGRVLVAVGLNEAGDRVVVAVTDTGPGIPADELDHVFQPFRQVGASSTRGTGGVGLGLAIVDRLVKVLGGTIAVSSEVGWGTTFRVELPRVAPTATRETSEAPPHGGRRPRPIAA